MRGRGRSVRSHGSVSVRVDTAGRALGCGHLRARADPGMKLLVCAAVMAAVIAAVIATGCGGSATSAEAIPKPLQLERWSPAQPSAYDVFVAAHGSIVVMTHRISRDGGATWTALDARVGQPGRVSIDGTTAALYAP